jgi:transposase
MARRGRPELIYSDNAKTFKATDKWLKRAQKDEQLHELLANRTIEWRFNLSRAPWWGGQFERLIGLFKRAFYKTIGNGTLKWEELEGLILDIEVALNNRPLSYLEDDGEC